MPFADVWNGRHHLKPKITVDWADNDWAKGRTRYLTFLIRVSDSTVRKALSKVQKRLSKFDCIDSFPQEYFHITAKECGRFLVQQKQHEDDVDDKELKHIITAAAKVLKDKKSFTVQLKNVNLFPDVLFVEVHDRDKIGELNKHLQTIPGIKKLWHDFPKFLPHVSIVQFKNDHDFKELLSALEKFRNVDFGTLDVNAVELVIAHLEGRYPTLEILHIFPLR